MIDFFGLVDPYIARLPGKLHEKRGGAISDYVFNRRPDYLVLRGGTDCRTGGFEHDRAFTRDPRLLDQYRFEWQNNALPQMWCLWVRKDVKLTAGNAPPPDRAIRLER